MYVDAITTAALVEELRQKLAGGRVQSVIEASRYGLGFEIYAHHRRHYLLATIEPKAVRCQIVPDKFRRGVETPSPLGLLLRKYVDGAWLDAISQPPLERILLFDFSHPNGTTRLIVEMMDQRSNIVLTQENEILYPMRQVPASKGGVRALLPGVPYQPPPAQSKSAPERLTVAQLETALRLDPDAPAWKALVGCAAGVSPLFAREVVFRACGEAAAPAFDLAPALLHESLQKMISALHDGEWEPGVARAEGGEGFRAFAAYRLGHLGTFERTENISEAMELYFGAPVGLEAYDAAKSTVERQLDGARERVRRKVAALERQAADDSQIEMLRRQGELIYAYAYTLKPGQTEFSAAYDPDEAPLTVRLDPTLTPSENARHYFERYEKAKRASQDVPALLEAAQGELDYLEQVASDLALAENWPEIDAVREVLQQAGYWEGPKVRAPRGGRPGIRRMTLGDGYVVLIGRNSEQNHRLVTEMSLPGDLWLHARGVPGSHVIIRHDGRPIPEAVIQRAAELAAYFSQGRSEAAVEVDITERRYVRPIRHARPGMVTYRNERTLTVRPSRQP